MQKFILSTLASVAMLFSVTVTGQIKGSVIEKSSGEPLQGAVVKFIEKAQNGKATTVLSGLDGTYAIKSLKAGSYEVEVTYVGYVAVKQNVTISGGENETLDFSLDREGAQLENVVVVGKTDRSDYITSQIERRSDNVINAVSAKTIEISPDLSVANVSQRVSGVSLQRSSNGEGQYAIVRGMEKRYNYTLINGIKIPSPDNKNRYVPLDIFPSDLLERLEVTKSLTPNMEGDAIGGVVNMVMKDAPERFSVKGSAAIGYAQTFWDGNKFSSFNHKNSSTLSPRIKNGESYLATMSDFDVSPFKTKASAPPMATNFNLSMGGRVLNNKLGILVAGSYQNSYRYITSTSFTTETDRVDNSVSFAKIIGRNYSVQQNRGGAHLRLDYVMNPMNKLKLYVGNVTLAENQFRFHSDTGLVLGRTGAGTGRVVNNRRTSRQIQNIFNVSLQGEHSISQEFSMNWSAVYSKATGNQPDRGNLVTSTGVIKDNSGRLVQQPEYLDNSTFRDWGRNKDEDKSGYLNFTYKSIIANTKVDWSFGGMYRDKNRNSDYDKYNIRPTPSPQLYNGDAAANTFSVFNPQGSSSDPLNYKAYEKVGAFYAMAKIETENLQVVAGARYENTDFNWVTSAPKTVEGAEGSIKYYDILPSVGIKYRLSMKQFLRLSYFSSISRPGFYEVTPHTFDDGISDYPEQGNPYLKRTTAENFDLRYEYFPKGLDQVLVGLFFKRINNPIEYAIVERGANATYYSPDNFGTGSNYGIEFDMTKYFHSFGIKANYTFTQSSITTSKVRRFQKTEGGTSTLTQEEVDQTRPLQGQSKHIGNLSLLYKNSKRGIDLQLAGVYTGARINTVSPFLDNDIWQKGFVQLDFSAEVRVIKEMAVFTKINNILNTPYELEIRQKVTQAKADVVPLQEAGKNAFVRKDIYGANYLLGVRFKL